MTTELTRLQTRRALLVGVAAAAGSWAAGLVGRAEPVSAANGSPVLLGLANTATATTTVTTSTGTGVAGVGPIGISGTANSTSATSAGVFGTSGSTANYGVMSSGKLGVTGPIEMTNLTITNYAGPATGKSFLYVKAITGGTELRIKFPSGQDKLIVSG